MQSIILHLWMGGEVDTIKLGGYQFMTDITKNF
jgi:hypothetical protein